jgi:CBS domain containing-hemolysin-like protein
MVKLIWVLGVSLSLSFLCSVLEAVLLSVTHAYAGVLKERGERAGEWWERMQAKIDEPIAAILTLNTIAHTVGAAMGGAIALDVFGDQWIALFSAVLTLVILLFSEIIPKTLGATYSNALAIPAAYVLRGMIILMKPVLVPLSWFNRLIQPRGERPSTVSRAEIEVLAEIGRREGTLDEDEWAVVSNVMSLDEVEVGEVMTPRTDMVAVSVEASVEEAQNLMLESGHLRLPVFENDLDHIVGLLVARDLWRAHREGAAEIRGVMRPIPFAPEGKPVEDLIPEMRARRSKMVIVLDEFGGTAGLATLEDLIEEIIGEIQDEHEDDEPEEFRDLGDGRFRVWGGALVRDFNSKFGAAIPEDAADTLGGYVFGRLGRIARGGDEIELPEGTLRVTGMRGRRVEFLRFTPRGEESD